MIRACADHRDKYVVATPAKITHIFRGQFFRYVLVGLGLNAAFYATYLLLTWRIMGSEAAMTITFSVGVLVSFRASRSVTFRYGGDQLPALRRYLAWCAILYLIDFIALRVFAGQMGVPHQIVQGCVVVVLPLLNFVVQKHWVFPTTASSVGPITTRTT
jgi:putative flippase GtrA